MRGDDRRPDDLFTYGRPEQQVPTDSPGSITECDRKSIVS